MALKIVKGKALPIGVDLGTSCVKMAQLKVAGDSLELLAASAIEVPHALRSDAQRRLGFYGRAIRDLVRTGAFNGRETMLGIPAEATFVQHVRVPKGPPQQVAEAVRQEITGKLPFPTKDAEIRQILAGDVAAEGEPRQEVIVVAVARSTLDAYLAMAKRAKLDVTGLNIEPCAIVDCFARLFRRTSDLQRSILFVDLGHRSTQVVLSHGNRIVFARNLSIAGQQLDEALAEVLQIPQELAGQMRRDLANGQAPVTAEEMCELLSGALDALAGEMMQCLRYHESVFRNQGIERAIFLGGQANDKRLCQALAQRLNLPAQIGDPLVRCSQAQGAGMGIGLDRRQPQPHWAVAIGLSLGGTRAA